MKHKRRIVGIALGVMLVAGVAWIMLSPRDPLFHGKPESYWITNIAYGMSLTDAQNKEQVQRWRDFGPEGLRVLERGLATKRGQTYRNIHGRLARILPGALLRLLPTPPPKIMGGTRHIVLDLLGRMGKDAHPAWPAVARALTDEDAWTRGSAISFFTRGEDDKALVNQLPAKEKKKLLPLFVRALEDGRGGMSLRNNAAIALRYYAEDGALVAPPLVKALQDPEPLVRLRSAETLNRVNPDAAKKADAVSVVTNLLRNPDDQIAANAASVLRQFQNEADIAVAALIEALHSTNSHVGCNAVWSLEWVFPQHADKIIPELKKASERKDNVGGYARSALKKLESKATTTRP